MDRPSQLIDASELELTVLLGKLELSKEDENSIGYLLTSIFTTYFSTLERETGMKDWSVDDMYPDEVRRTEEKITLVGNIYWLGGGGECIHYQADIATNTNPILYSVKLKNKRQKQIVYIGKTRTGWILNAT